MTKERIIPLALAAILGCMHGGAQRASTVSEADAGRLGPEQVGLVTQARQGVDAAQDALSRTRLHLQEARNEEGLAKADLQAAEADQKVADAQRKVANDSRAPDALERARLLQEQATAHREVADLHVEYARKLVGQREAEVQAAERQLQVAQARVEWSKLQALEQAGNPAATKYDAGRFQSAVSDAEGDAAQAAGKAQTLEAQASAARQRWEDSQRRLPVDGRREETGTGSGK